LLLAAQPRTPTTILPTLIHRAQLIQNADDAGASVCRFCLDLTEHGTASTLSPRMAELQGPALLACNDATFSPGDFRAIASIGQAGKMGQPAAVGRFGLGFNAVYHCTDVPSFVSGGSLVLFDPRALFEREGAGARGGGERLTHTTDAAPSHANTHSHSQTQTQSKNSQMPSTCRARQPRSPACASASRAARSRASPMPPRRTAASAARWR
jgi:hypothetical protein